MPDISGPVPFRGAWLCAAVDTGSGRGNAHRARAAVAIRGERRGDLDAVPPCTSVDRPSAVPARAKRRVMAASGRLVEPLAIGWSLGTVFGIAVGFLVGIAVWARSPGMAVVSALFPIPKIALVPLFIIWFGIGEGSKIATLGLGVFFPTVINTAAGVDAVPRGLVRMGQAFGLSRAAIIWRILLPGATPAILSGFRVTSSIAIILLVAAEMIGAERGIGAFVLQAGNLYDTDNLLAGIVVLSLLGLTVAWLLGMLERVLLRWR